MVTTYRACTLALLTENIYSDHPQYTLTKSDHWKIPQWTSTVGIYSGHLQWTSTNFDHFTENVYRAYEQRIPTVIAH